jgi:putative SOS response-associated peptidase YedK
MCGRFTIAASPGELMELMELAEIPDIRPRYNVAPSQEVLAARLNAAGTREAALLHWGLVPHWADDIRIGYKMINARCETLAQKPSFREAFKKRRCLIPADGLYEWRVEGKRKQPFRFRRPDGRPFVFAGLWEKRERPGSPLLESCTIVTTAANAMVRPFHERMPLILTNVAVDRWLTPAPLAADAAAALFAPLPEEFLIAEPVSTLVNSPRVDDARCIEVQSV